MRLSMEHSLNQTSVRCSCYTDRSLSLTCTSIPFISEVWCTILGALRGRLFLEYRGSLSILQHLLTTNKGSGLQYEHPCCHAKWMQDLVHTYYRHQNAFGRRLSMSFYKCNGSTVLAKSRFATVKSKTIETIVNEHCLRCIGYFVRMNASHLPTRA